jgi:hypothetical protein
MESQELDPNDVALSLGGRTLLQAGHDLDSLERRLAEGWTFRRTRLSEEFGFDAYCATLAQDDQLIVAVKPDARLSLATVSTGVRPLPRDSVVAFVCGDPPAMQAAEALS